MKICRHFARTRCQSTIAAAALARLGSWRQRRQRPLQSGASAVRASWCDHLAPVLKLLQLAAAHEGRGGGQSALLQRSRPHLRVTKGD
jgi:hypothetical protein